MNIDELERLASEADEGYSGAHPRDSNNWEANEAFCRAASPDVMAKLIAVVRAAQEWAEKMTAIEADPQYQGMWTSAFVHGLLYAGPTYTAEKAALREALAAVKGTP